MSRPCVRSTSPTRPQQIHVSCSAAFVATSGASETALCSSSTVAAGCAPMLSSLAFCCAVFISLATSGDSPRRRLIGEFEYSERSLHAPQKFASSRASVAARHLRSAARLRNTATTARPSGSVQ
jgi:hypothetical protein